MSMMVQIFDEVKDEMLEAKLNRTFHLSPNVYICTIE